MLSFTKEPQVARYTSNKVMIKDHYYYKGDDFSWNRPARVNEKYYPYFLKQQDENKAKIEDMKQQEIEDKDNREALRREKLIEKKINTKQSFDSRVKEREVIQRMSNQPLLTNNFFDLPEEDTKVIYDIVAKRFNSGKHFRTDEFSWNNLTRASKKNVAIFLGSYSLKGEEEMLKRFKEKLEEENKGEENERVRRSEFHKKIRDMFLTRHEENVSRNDMITRPSTAKCTSYFTVSRPKSPNMPIPSLNLNGGLNSQSPFTNTLENRRLETLSSPKEYDKGTRYSITPSLDKLALSREPTKKEFNLGYNDCKGMLIKNMDGKAYYPGNNFYDALVSQSKVFRETMEENRINKRDTSSHKTIHTRPPTSLSNKTIMIRPMTSQSKLTYNSNPDLPVKQVNSDGNIIIKINKSQLLNKKNLQLTETSDGINDQKCSLEEINTFEHKFCKSGKKVGYARLNLEEAYKLTDAKGLSTLQKIEAKKQEPLVK